MDTEAIVARLGVLACLAVLVLTALPYVYIDPNAVVVYYDAGLLGPPYFALAAVVAALALQSGVVGRSDPPTAAGIALSFSLALALLALIWAFAVSPAVVGGATEAAWFDYHRWTLAVAAVIAPVASAFYAREVV